MSEARLFVFSRVFIVGAPRFCSAVSISWSKVGAVFTIAGVFTGSKHCQHPSSFTDLLSDITNSPLLKAGIGGTSSLAASSLARVDRCDSEKLRNFNMLKRLVRAFSGWTGGEDGRSDGRVAVERRDVGGAYSLFGRGEVGGRAREVVLERAALSVLVGCWESGFGLKTLRRRRSRGMAGTRNYIYKGSRIGALTRRWWLDWYWYWYW